MDKRLPKRLYYLLVDYGEGAKLRVYEKGGGKYTSLAAATTQRNRLIARGIPCKIYQTPELSWEEVLDTPR